MDGAGRFFLPVKGLGKDDRRAGFGEGQTWLLGGSGDPSLRCALFRMTRREGEEGGWFWGGAGVALGGGGDPSLRCAPFRMTRREEGEGGEGGSFP